MKSLKQSQKKINRTKQLVHISMMLAVTVALSFVRIPFYPVAFTLQTLAAMLTGILLSRWAGVLCQVLYLFIGLMGLPVFSQGGGIGYIFSPTFGFVLFLPMLTLLVSLFYEKLKVLGLILPSLMLLIFGTTFYIIMHKIPINKQLLDVIWAFCLVFVPAEILKSFCAYALGTRLKRFLFV